MFEQLLLPGTISFKDTIGIYVESVKEFFDEIMYYVAKFELQL